MSHQCPLNTRSFMSAPLDRERTYDTLDELFAALTELDESTSLITDWGIYEIDPEYDDKAGFQVTVCFTTTAAVGSFSATECDEERIRAWVRDEALPRLRRWYNVDGL